MPDWDVQWISAWSGLIGVSAIGGITFVVQNVRGRQQMVQLENYLRMRKANFPESYQHTIEHLMVRTNLTRDQIERAVQRSSKINRVPRQSRRGMALPYLLEWRGEP